MLVNICDECGRVVDINAKRCSYCGCPIEATFENSSPVAVPGNVPTTIPVQAPNHNTVAHEAVISDKANSQSPIGFSEAIRNYYLNYLNFKGKSTRSEFWWVFLYQSIVSSILGVLAVYLPGVGFLSLMFALTHEIPYLALTARRLHDVGKPASYLLFFFLPIAGPFVVLYYTLQKSST